LGSAGSTSLESSCSSCINFRRHLYLPFLGLCGVRGDVVTEDSEACESFARASQEELRRVLTLRGWLYCPTCRRVLVTEEELAEHGHGITEAYIDDVISEEAPPGD